MEGLEESNYSNMIDCLMKTLGCLPQHERVLETKTTFEQYVR